ncbi:MAG: hypothetical protein AVDCRST_MAG19-2253, partial [uncultured Thermomicrobiales bacterium]
GAGIVGPLAACRPIAAGTDHASRVCPQRPGRADPPPTGARQLRRRLPGRRRRALPRRERPLPGGRAGRPAADLSGARTQLRTGRTLALVGALSRLRRPRLRPLAGRRLARPGETRAPPRADRALGSPIRVGTRRPPPARRRAAAGGGLPAPDGAVRSAPRFGRSRRGRRSGLGGARLRAPRSGPEPEPGSGRSGPRSGHVLRRLSEAVHPGDGGTSRPLPWHPPHRPGLRADAAGEPDRPPDRRESRLLRRVLLLAPLQAGHRPFPAAVPRRSAPHPI